MEFKQRTLKENADRICGNFKEEASFFRYRGFEPEKVGSGPRHPVTAPEKAPFCMAFFISRGLFSLSAVNVAPTSRSSIFGQSARSVRHAFGITRLGVMRRYC
jgi:hypothetical protein